MLLLLPRLTMLRRTRSLRGVRCQRAEVHKHLSLEECVEVPIRTQRWHPFRCRTLRLTCCVTMLRLTPALRVLFAGHVGVRLSLRV